MLKKLIIAGVALVIVGVVGIYAMIRSVKAGLPQLITVKDYQPLLVSEVYDRKNKKIGELSRDERRIVVPYEKMPKNLVHAFLAAEDDQFFQHGGINYQAILRATLANLRAGRTVQGGSTITQQVAKTLLLRDREKTFLRKIREAMLAQQMEENLKKEDILYLYLNQIYFGQGAYGVEVAAQTYYHKSVDQLTLAEMAILAGLPQAPARYSPVTNPLRAKERQTYVLHRMAEVGFVSKEEAEAAVKQPVKVYVRENYIQFAPSVVETVRQLLVAQLGEEQVLDKGLKIYTSIELDKQLAAQESVVTGLKELDKRQGYRGALRQLATKEEIEKFLVDGRKKLIAESTPIRMIMPDGKFADIRPEEESKVPTSPNLPSYLKVGQSVEGLVEKIDDAAGLVYVRVGDAKGLIDFSDMMWARKPNTDKRWDLDTLKKPSDALKPGDVILVKISGEVFTSNRLSNPSKNSKKPAPVLSLPDFHKYLAMDLDQEPLVEGSLISFDEQTSDVLAMVGGYSYARNEFNRALQAARQTGSSFKTIVYASALDKGFTPATPIMDSPIVFEETDPNKDDSEGQDDAKVWKPANHSKSFGGDIIFRNALVKSLNIPSVKIIEDVGIPWASDYAKRLGIFSPLNPDFTLVLGSSSVTLYEMTKVFGEFGRLGKRIRPVIIRQVLNQDGQKILDEVSLDTRFNKEITELDKQFDDRRQALADKVKTMTPEQIAEDKKKKPDYNFFFEDKDQLIKPQTAYIMTTLLKGVIEDKNGTGGRARSLGREVAGKTGTTNGYYDAWFIGYTPQIVTGVWVGFDKERSIGKGEVGGRAALPIWVEYMKAAHQGLPQTSFPVPEGIVFANIDSDTGKLASATTKNVLRQAFAEGSEPTSASNKAEEATDFLKEDLAQ